jgi:hypothetical protein
MTVVRNEFERGENNVQNVLEERVVAAAYLWHNYGKAVIGSRADIERVPIDRLAAFYRKYYQPDNAVLVIAGQFDTTKALAMAAETVGAIPRPARVLDVPYTVEPAQDGERFVELRRTGSTPVMMAAWHGPALAHQDSAAVEVLAGVMVGGGGRGGGAGTGRLYKPLVGVHVGRGVSRSWRRAALRHAQRRAVARRGEEDPRHGGGAGARGPREGGSGSGQDPHRSGDGPGHGQLLSRWRCRCPR